MEIKNEKWDVVEHSWSDTSIYNQDNEIICTLSIDDEDTTEENQEEREQIVSERFLLISKAPEMLEMLIRCKNINSIAKEHINESLFEDIESLIKKATEL